jgi:uncharacterized repeat protein (TIGR01451 family)
MSSRKGIRICAVCVLSLLLVLLAFPATAGAQPVLEASKLVTDTDGGGVLPGDTLTYAVGLINSGDAGAAQFVDPIPANTTYVLLSAQVIQGGGSISYDTPNNRITWSGTVAAGPENMVIMTFSVRISGSASDGTVISNSGTLNWGTSSEPTDDPSTPAIDDDPTNIVVGQELTGIYAEKGVFDLNGGTALPGETLRYDLVLANTSAAALQSRLTDPIPQHVSYVAGSARAVDVNGDPAGAVSYNSTTKRILWEGSIPATGLVYLSFQVTVDATTPAGTMVSNQGTLTYDSDGNGTPDTNIPTDNPLTGEADDATKFTVSATPIQTWYLAEGATDGGFETWVLIQNPNPDPVHVDILLQTDQGEVVDPNLVYMEIPALSRRSFNIGEYVTTYNVSTQVNSADGYIVCERAMYGGNRTWAHDSIGTTAPATTWYLAEGSTGGDMETFVLIQNPGTTAATVDIAFQTDAGEVAPAALQGVSIAAGSRQTFKANDFVPDNYNVSTKVEATSGEVICERAMYGGNRTWAHDSIGYAP